MENTFNSIPKIIHYCWFGDNKKSKLIKKCIASWKKICPDYMIREWNDKDLKFINNKYVNEAAANKKYAFVSDYFRLYALYNFGGVYLDSDNELFKPLDEFLNLDFFSGYENWNGIIAPFTAVVGAKKGNKIVEDLLREYDNISFINNGILDIETNTSRVSKYFSKVYNLYKPYCGEKITELEPKCILFPYNYFCNYEENVSYAVHHFNASWKKKKFNLLEKIFSIKNTYNNNIKIKNIKILGFKISFKPMKQSQR